VLAADMGILLQADKVNQDLKALQEANTLVTKLAGTSTTAAVTSTIGNAPSLNDDTVRLGGKVVSPGPEGPKSDTHDSSDVELDITAHQLREKAMRHAKVQKAMETSLREQSEKAARHAKELLDMQREVTALELRQKTAAQAKSIAEIEAKKAADRDQAREQKEREALSVARAQAADTAARLEQERLQKIAEANAVLQEHTKPCSPRLVTQNTIIRPQSQNNKRQTEPHDATHYHQ
jgi:hypothetical protein